MTELNEITRKLKVETQIIGMASTIMEDIFKEMDMDKITRLLKGIENHCDEILQLTNRAREQLTLAHHTGEIL